MHTRLCCTFLLVNCSNRWAVLLRPEQATAQLPARPPNNPKALSRHARTPSSPSWASRLNPNSGGQSELAPSISGSVVACFQVERHRSAVLAHPLLPVGLGLVALSSSGPPGRTSSTATKWLQCLSRLRRTSRLLSSPSLGFPASASRPTNLLRCLGVELAPERHDDLGKLNLAALNETLHLAGHHKLRQLHILDGEVDLRGHTLSFVTRLCRPPDPNCRSLRWPLPKKA